MRSCQSRHLRLHLREVTDIESRSSNIRTVCREWIKLRSGRRGKVQFTFVYLSQPQLNGPAGCTCLARYPGPSYAGCPSWGPWDMGSGHRVFVDRYCPRQCGDLEPPGIWRERFQVACDFLIKLFLRGITATPFRFPSKLPRLPAAQKNSIEK